MVNIQEQEEKKYDEKINPSYIVPKIVLSNELCGPKVSCEKTYFLGIYLYSSIFYCKQKHSFRIFRNQDQRMVDSSIERNKQPQLKYKCTRGTSGNLRNSISLIKIEFERRNFRILQSYKIRFKTRKWV